MTSTHPQPARRSQRIPVAILGATGAVGQRMIRLLEHHPWFEIAVVTGAGNPGVAALDVLDNIIPNIADGGEEAKLEHETRKLLGYVGDGQIDEASITLSAQVTRVPVIDGHTVLLSIGFERRPTPE